MKDDHRNDLGFSKGSTRTDMRPTRQPADTPRGRLHRLAATVIRAADLVRRNTGLDQDDMVQLRGLARRGLALLVQPRSRGERLVARFCSGLDKTIYALTLVDACSVIKLCEGLTLTLVQLEAAETAMLQMEAELARARADARSARGDIEELRELLSKAYSSAAKKEAEEKEVTGEWNEQTRQRALTTRERRVVDDPDAS